MAKVVVANLNPKHGRPASVTERRVRDSAGRIETLRILDTESRTFGEDLKYVFSKNVAKARRENKRVIGATDVAIVKR